MGLSKWWSNRCDRRNERRTQNLQYRLALANEILKRTGPAIFKEQKYLHLAVATRYTRGRIKYFQSLERTWSRRRETCIEKLGIHPDAAGAYDWLFVQQAFNTRFKDFKQDIRFAGLTL